MITLISQMIAAGFFSAALLWTVGFLWMVVTRAANLAAVE